MPEMLVPKQYAEAALTEKRSRFLARLWPVEREDAVVESIRATQKRHWDATHNVYAYLLHDAGIVRHSDDGEPQGTAGLPVLDVFRKNGVTNVLCVVTRYFGGVLLGAGGLVRAYGTAAGLALDAAGVVAVIPWRRLEIAFDYHYFNGVRRLLADCGGRELNAVYTERVTLETAIPESDADRFAAALSDVTGGKAVMQVLGELRAARPD